jgi:hypothetical protein
VTKRSDRTRGGRKVNMGWDLKAKAIQPGSNRLRGSREPPWGNVYYFTPQSNAAGNTVYTSNVFTVNNADDQPITIAACGGGSCEYRIDGGVWTSAPGIYLATNLNVQVRAKSSPTVGITVRMTLQIGISLYHYDIVTTQLEPALYVSAGGPYSGLQAMPISLDGTITAGSSTLASSLWTIVSGGTGTFASASSIDTTFTPDSSGTYVLRLTGTPVTGSPVSSDTNLTATFSPLSLTPTVLYDPSDLSTMFKTSDQSIPVTASNDPVGLILDKSQNFTTGPELFVVATVVPYTGNGTISVSGDEITCTCTVSGLFGFRTPSVMTGGVVYKGSATVLTNASARSVILYPNLMAPNGITLGTAATTKAYTSYCPTAAGGNASLAASATGVIGDVIVFKAVTQKVLNGNHATQATSTKRPLYQTSGGLHWLKGDGVDDALVTGSFAFGSDAVSLLVGVSKLDDTARVLCEFSANWASNVGSFAIVTGVDVATGYNFGARGTQTVSSSQVATVVNSGADTSVITCTADISLDSGNIYRNSVAGTQVVYEKGTGDFGTYPLHLFARAGTSMYNNASIYPFILVNRVITAEERAAAESWVAAKTGVTL